MNLNEINIRDPFILKDDNVFYLYGTRAYNFGKNTGGFDVYMSNDMLEWSDPIECFNSIENGMNKEVNWAPEVHIYNDKYYMFATFTSDTGLRGTYCLTADSPVGPFELHSESQLTPKEWECLDGTLYIDKSNTPFLVFCHEHTQIIDGTVCYVRLSKDLTKAVGESVTLFKASSPYWVKKKRINRHYITDGPFLFRNSFNELFMLWSTSVKGKYAQCIAKSSNGNIDGTFKHLPPIISDDGGHGMIFEANNKLYLTFHTPNKSGQEHPIIIEVKESNNSLVLAQDI